MTTMTLPVLSPVSSPESYVQAVNAIPMLTAEREIELGRRLKETGDVTAARQPDTGFQPGLSQLQSHV